MEPDKEELHYAFTHDGYLKDRVRIFEVVLKLFFAFILTSVAIPLGYWFMTHLP